MKYLSGEMNNKVIFWDFDGTLVKTEAPWSNSILASIKEIKPDSKLILTDVRPLMQSGFTWDNPWADHTGITGVKWWLHMGEHFKSVAVKLGFNIDDAVKIAQRVRGHMLDIEKYQMFPDAVSTLDIAKEKGYKSYVLSNNYPEVEETANKLGIADKFEGFIVSSLVGYEKPRREIFEEALFVAGNPNVGIMIGDNLKADIDGGNAAGLITVLVHKPPYKGADYCFEDLASVLKIL